jgi:hypothetical protein
VHHDTAISRRGEASGDVLEGPGWAAAILGSGRDDLDGGERMTTIWMTR